MTYTQYQASSHWYDTSVIQVGSRLLGTLKGNLSHLILSSIAIFHYFSFHPCTCACASVCVRVCVCACVFCVWNLLSLLWTNSLYGIFLNLCKMAKNDVHSPIISRKVIDIKMFVPQLNTVAVATALPFIPTGNISVRMSHATVKVNIFSYYYKNTMQVIKNGMN